MLHCRNISKINRLKYIFKRSMFYSALFSVMFIFFSIALASQTNAIEGYDPNSGGTLPGSTNTPTLPPVTKRIYVNTSIKITVPKDSTNTYGPVDLYQYLKDDKTNNTANATKLVTDSRAKTNASSTSIDLVNQQIDSLTDPSAYKICIKDGTNCSDITKQSEDTSGVTYTATINISEKDSVNYIAKTITPPSSSSSCGIPGLGWLICPIINFMAKIADYSFVFLSDNFLATSPSIFTTETNGVNPTFNAWSTMRNISNIAFVVVFLVIILSQVTSYGISNYGIKKMLPRLIIAAILVNVSYFICQIAVDISNIAGYSLKDLLANLVTTNEAGKSVIESGDSIWANIAAGTLAVGAGGLVAWGALALLIPALLAAVLALVVILFILVARQALIILLIVISPLAFVAYLLPNTEAWFKKWKTTFTSLLILFPIIAVVFGASSLASTILSGVFSAQGDTIGKIIASLVLVVPLFAVPSLLKKSLDAIPQIGQLANKYASSANANMSNKINDVYKNGDYARGKAIRNNAKLQFRNQQFADRLSRSPISRTIAGGGASILAKTGLATGSMKAQSTAIVGSARSAADAAERTDIAAQKMLLKSQFVSNQGKKDANGNMINSYPEAFKDAVKNGDSIKMMAAMELQLEGSRGRDGAHELIKGAMQNSQFVDSGNATKLRNHIMNTRPGIGSEDVVLANWVYANSDVSVSETSASTYNEISDAALAKQTITTLKRANLAGSLTAKRAASMLDDINISRELLPETKDYLNKIKDGLREDPGMGQPNNQTPNDNPGNNNAQQNNQNSQNNQTTQQPFTQTQQEQAPAGAVGKRPDGTYYDKDGKTMSNSGIYF